ncbi:glycosyl transferase [Rhizobium paknamense]|uniref:Glycosyl transferase n=1 Tax=Rhizobium paknamense TaxID=1206817 RepID=A0ABU0I9V4_9HYPH|nr:glycosyl transferase [Rhizobium paknamense]MDQ0455014.1 hypothetical protein [Rhizobium paknamense]
MLTVIIECQDQESELAHTLMALVSGAVEGVISDVVILDNGSRDGTPRLADAAGCRFYARWELKDIITAARGEWLLLVEPGARPNSGWIEEIAEYVALNTAPARFSPSRAHRPSLFRRLGRRCPPLEHGFLLPKQQALSLARTGMRSADLVSGLSSKALSSELVPARALKGSRMGTAV